MASIMRPRPRVMHLLSDWKWSPQAEAIVVLCRQLRRHGYEVDFICAAAPKSSNASIQDMARQRQFEPMSDFHLARRKDYLAMFGEIARLQELFEREEVEIVHVHSMQDHYFASRAARKAASQPFVVRSNDTGIPIRPTFSNKWIIKSHTDAWVAVNDWCRDEDAVSFQIHPSRAIVIDADGQQFAGRNADLIAELYMRLAEGR